MFNIFIIVSLIVFLSTLLYLYYLRTIHNRYMRNVPGPKPHFLLGNIIDFIFAPTTKYIDVCMGYLAKYGPIVKFYHGPLQVTAIIADPKFSEYILSSTKYIDKANEYEFLHNWIGEGLAVSTGTKWKKRRRVLTSAFHFSILHNFVDVFENVSDVFVEKLEEEVGNKSFDISELVRLCALDVICEAAMGTKLNALNDKTSAYVTSTKRMCKIFSERLFSIIYPSLYPLTLNYYREQKAVKVIHTYTDHIIDRKMAEKKTSQTNEVDENGDGVKKKLAFLDLLLDCQIDGKPLSKADISEEVRTFTFAGHDSAATTINFLIYNLAMHPHVQEKVFLEQKQIFPDWRNAKNDVSSLQQMKYLECVIKESLRLYPPLPFMGRKLPEDLEWDGNVYRKGTSLLISMFAMHRNPKYFPNPLEFIPERFADTNLTNPYVYIPFSAGPRNCIGQKFAMLELKCIMSKVLRNFELLPASPIHELQLAPETMLVSKNGVCISLKRRTDT